MDSVEKQKEFRDTEKLPFPLIADEKGEVVEAFGVRKLGKFASRQAFLFEDGSLVWRDTKASTDKQADDVLEAVGEES